MKFLKLVIVLSSEDSSPRGKIRHGCGRERQQSAILR
jgi:hypothetical protein